MDDVYIETSDELIAAQTPLPFPVPHPVVVPDRISRWARFFARLTGLALSAGIIVALVAVTSERNGLQTELFCRSQAAIAVNKAVNVRDNLISNGLILIAQGDTDGLNSSIDDLQKANKGVDDSIDAQEVALKACKYN